MFVIDTLSAAALLAADPLRDGPPAHAGFIGTLRPSDYYITDVDVGPSGSVYAADAFHDVITRFDTDGSVLARYSIPEFIDPRYLAVGADGRIYASDPTADTVWVLSSDGVLVDSFPAGSNRGVDVDALGRVIVTLRDDDSILVLDRSGQELLRFGVSGSGPGELDGPTDVFGTPDGDIYVADRFNDRIQVFDQQGEFLTAFGRPGSGPGEFRTPKAVALDSTGNSYVLDRANNRVQRFSPEGEFILEFGERGRGPGLLLEPEGLTVGPDDTVWIAGYHANDIQHFAADGTFLDQWIGYVSGDGEFSDARGVALSQGILFVADHKNSRIQAFDPLTREFLYEFGERDNGPATVFDHPSGVTTGPEGDLYIADDSEVRRIRPDGTFVALFERPPGRQPQSYGLAVSNDGILYQADFFNDRVHLIDTGTGEILSTFGGPGSAPGQFQRPWGIAWSDAGIVYVADKNNDRVQLFTTEGDYLSEWPVPRPRALALDPRSGILYVGRFSTVQAHVPATGELLYSWGTTGDGPGQFDGIDSITLDAGGTVLYVSDSKNGRVQRFVYPDASDVDADGLVDLLDNCIEVPNDLQRDTDGDGYGNLCDADLDDDCLVRWRDFALLREVLFTANPDADLNGDGIVSRIDQLILVRSLFSPPGPSGLSNECG